MVCRSQRGFIPFILIGLVLISFASFGQKVKYKELFLLLNSKQYDVAEPFLKRFIKDNPDHPNALMYMGIVYQEKSNKEDVLKETASLNSHIDSAILFYEKAFKEIDEKEVKKNDEFYESYKRRDLRSGEFTIKLSDVQYDLDKRMQGLKERKTRIASLKEQLTSAEHAYAHALAQYEVIQKQFPGQRELVLRSDDQVVESLSKLTASFDSSMIAFRNYKTTSQILGKTNYNQILNLQEIKDLKRDGGGTADFTKDDLRLWDYKTWTQQTLQTIDKDIAPLRESLVAFDIEINHLREKLKKDSSDITLELAQLAAKSPGLKLKKVDPDAMPNAVFEMKIAELHYGNELVSSKPYKDSLNVSLWLRRLDAELRRINRLDTLAGLLNKRDFDAESENYKHFVTSAYGTVDVLKSLVKTTFDYANRERLKKQREWETRSQSLKWIVNGADSIPLFTDETTGRNKFKSLVTVPDDYTMGLYYPDSVATGYFYTITPSRVPDVKATFPIDKVHFTKRNLPIIHGLSVRDDKRQVYFSAIYSDEKVHDKYTVMIAKIYRSDGLAWSRTFLLDLVPAVMIFDPSTGELSVKTVSANGDIKLVVIDKNGKLIP